MARKARIEIDPDLPKSREEAIFTGAMYYFTGEPCMRGHVDKRYVKNRQCQSCKRLSRRTPEGQRTRRDWSEFWEQNGITEKKDKHAVWQAECKKKYPGRYMWRAAKARAKESGLEFTITQDDIEVPEVCPVLGIRLEPGEATRWNAPSLDRFDSSKGYTKENTRVISHRANFLKNDATLDELEKIVAYMKQGS